MTEAIKPPVVIPKDFVFDANTVMFAIYLLFKANIITRNNLAHIMKIIKETKSELDINEFLIIETKKI